MVEIVCPTDATAKINAILSGRRGQILGFDTREGWPGWDRVRAMMPEAEIGELIVELRSATAGAGSFTRAFDRMAEVTGRAADQIIAAHRVAACLCLSRRCDRVALTTGGAFARGACAAFCLPCDVFYIIVTI